MKTIRFLSLLIFSIILTACGANTEEKAATGGLGGAAAGAVVGGPVGAVVGAGLGAGAGAGAQELEDRNKRSGQSWTDSAPRTSSGSAQ